MHEKEMELIKAEEELLLIKRQKCLSEKDSTLESIFYKHSKSAMMSAKFYHECMILNIPCVLEVFTQFGRVDCIIEVEGKFIIVEFKSTIEELKCKETKKQLQKYSKHNYPVILIKDIASFSELLIKIKSYKLLNKIYVYTLAKIELY